MGRQEPESQAVPRVGKGLASGLGTGLCARLGPDLGRAERKCGWDLFNATVV